MAVNGGKNRETRKEEMAQRRDLENIGSERAEGGV